MRRNRCLDPTANATCIRAVPILAGVRKESVVVPMAPETPIPHIPDHAISFQDMGEIIHSYDHAAYGQRPPERPPPAAAAPRKERAQWSRMEARAEQEYMRTKTEYDLLVRELAGALGTE